MPPPSVPLPPGTSRLRAWRRLIAVAALLLLCLPLHGLWRLCGRPSPWPRRFLGGTAWAAGARAVIVGKPLADHVLFVANHLSWMDILLLAGATGTRFVAKDEVAGWPAIGWLAGLNRTVYVARAKRGQVQAQAGMLRAALSEAQPLTLFAEGTTGNGVTLAPFRASLFAAVAPPPLGVRVQPVAIDYDDGPLMAWPDALSPGADAMRVMAHAGHRRVTLRFAEPVDPALLGDRKAIAAACEAAVARALGVGAPAIV